MDYDKFRELFITKKKRKKMDATNGAAPVKNANNTGTPNQATEKKNN
jgi:hypothetical protein